MHDRELIERAIQAREAAYAPYSSFLVGCALLAKDEQVFVGCNVENASYSATCCAERVAFGSAIASGCRDFQKIAIVGGAKNTDINGFCMPCGICRQVMREFCKDDFEIIVYNGDKMQAYKLCELLPHSFSQKNLLED